MMRLGRGQTIRGRVLMLWAALLTSAVWGCEGSHLFAPLTIGPQITELTAPASAQSGDSLIVRVRALGSVRVDSIVATVRIGAYEQSQVAAQLGILSDFSTAFDFGIPIAVADTLGTIEAYAVDGRASIGPTANVTVRLIDTAAPTVSLSLQSPNIGLGTDFDVTISAQDNIGLSQIGFQILDLAGDLIAEVLVDQSGTTAEQLVTYSVPDDLALGDVVIVGLAVDHAGNAGVGLPIPARVVDVDLPEIEILTPASGAQEPAQDPLSILVRLVDNDAVDSVRIDGVSHRGDASLGTDEVVVRFLPRLVNFIPPVTDTVLQRDLVPAADSTGENAFIRIAAYDRQGNVLRDSVEVSLLADDVAPLVRIDTPSQGGSAAIGTPLLVDTFIEELPAPFRSGITTLRLEGLAFRGDPELGTDQVVPRFLTRTVTFDPPVLDGLAISRSLPATSDMTEEPVFVIATAIDAWGNESADTVSIQLAPDTIAPAVNIVFPVGGSAWPAGDSILVQAFGAEPTGEPNQSGVSLMKVDGVSYRPAQILKFTEQQVGYSPPLTQALLNVWIHPTGDTTLETVWIQVTAEDVAGNMTPDSIMITLTPPPPAPPPPPPPSLGLLPGAQESREGRPSDRSLFARSRAELELWVRGVPSSGGTEAVAGRRRIPGRDDAPLDPALDRIRDRWHLVPV